MMREGLLKKVLLIAVGLSASWGSAVQASQTSYFVSIKPQARGVLVNVRSGPGQNYPVEWQLVRARWPLEVLRKFEHWRQIRDADGQTGWVHKNMLSGQRFVALIQTTFLYEKPNPESRVIAQLEKNLIGYPLECGSKWCLVRFESMKGWVPQPTLWGIFPGETKF